MQQNISQTSSTSTGGTLPRNENTQANLQQKEILLYTQALSSYCTYIPPEDTSILTDLSNLHEQLSKGSITTQDAFSVLDSLINRINLDPALVANAEAHSSTTPLFLPINMKQSEHARLQNCTLALERMINAAAEANDTHARKAKLDEHEQVIFSELSSLYGSDDDSTYIQNLNEEIKKINSMLHTHLTVLPSSN